MVWNKTPCVALTQLLNLGRFSNRAQVENTWNKEILQETFFVGNFVTHNNGPVDFCSISHRFDSVRHQSAQLREFFSFIIRQERFPAENLIRLFVLQSPSQIAVMGHPVWYSRAARPREHAASVGYPVGTFGLGFATSFPNIRRIRAPT